MPSSFLRSIVIRSIGNERALAVGLVALSAAGTVTALSVNAESAGSSLQCGRHVISIGTPAYRVEHLCGAPVQRNIYREYQIYGTSAGTLLGSSAALCGDFLTRAREVVAEEWIYDFGPKQLTRHVTFHHGKVASVKGGAYGVKARASDSEDGKPGGNEAKPD